MEQCKIISTMHHNINIMDKISTIWRHDLNNLVDVYNIYIKKFKVPAYDMIERPKILGAYLEFSKHKKVV